MWTLSFSVPHLLRFLIFLGNQGISDRATSLYQVLTQIEGQIHVLKWELQNINQSKGKYLVELGQLERFHVHLESEQGVRIEVGVQQVEQILPWGFRECIVIRYFLIPTKLWEYSHLHLIIGPYLGILVSGSHDVILLILGLPSFPLLLLAGVLWLEAWLTISHRYNLCYYYNIHKI